MNYQFSHTSLIPNVTSNERDLTIHRFPISRINIPTSSHMNEKLSLSTQTSFTQLNQGTLILKTSIQTFNFILTKKTDESHLNNVNPNRNIITVEKVKVFSNIRSVYSSCPI